MIPQKSIEKFSDKMKSSLQLLIHLSVGLLVNCLQDEKGREKERREKWNSLLLPAAFVSTILTGTGRGSKEALRVNIKALLSWHEIQIQQWTLCITCTPAFHLLFLPFAFTGLSSLPSLLTTRNCEWDVQAVCVFPVALFLSLSLSLSFSPLILSMNVCPVCLCILFSSKMF